MAQIIPFPADAEEPELEALSREALLALAQELREKLAELDAREPGGYDEQGLRALGRTPRSA